MSGLAKPSVAACFSSPNIHSVDIFLLHFNHSLRSQHSPSKLIFGLYSCPTFNLYSNLCPPFHSLPPKQCEHPWYSVTHPTSQIFILFNTKFYKQQIVLGMLSNMVKWPTLCVSFLHVPWFKIFKINHLIASNVRFGTFSQNPVAYIVNSYL